MCSSGAIKVRHSNTNATRERADLRRKLPFLVTSVFSIYNISVVKDLRNRLDYFLRNRLTWGREIPEGFPVPQMDLRFQEEVREFFDAFPWPEILEPAPRDRALVVADIGTRNFATAPVIDDLFARQGFAIDLHGIEVDAYRRLRDFRTRKNYGDFFARQARRARYHALDFCEWRAHCDFIFLLNPFVSEEPLLAWGLPLPKLRPRAIFERAAASLTKYRGQLLLCCPTEEELEISAAHADAVGLVATHAAEWHPKPTSLQNTPRLGTLYRLK